MARSLLGRWTHRRALFAVGLAGLLASAIFYLTRRGDEAPYTPGGEVEGITDVNRRTAPKEGWGITFRDVSAASGLDFVHFSGGVRSTQLPEDMGSGCAFGDYDRDGDWDLFVADTIGPLTMSREDVRRAPGGCRLYRNDGGRFTDVTAEAGLGGLKGTYMGAAWGDYDNDGYPDLVVTGYGEVRLFHNQGDGTFREVTASSGLGRFHGFYTGASWGDVDGDGLLDLYVCGYVGYKLDPKDVGRASKWGNATSPFTINPTSYPPIPNLLFRNRGNGKFEEVALEAGVANEQGRSLSASFADLNDDGRPDIYVANDVSEGALFINAGDGLFEDRGHQAHVADYRGAMGIAVGDPNGDGVLDMFVTHWIAEANAFYLNRLRSRSAGPVDFEDAAERFGLGQISMDDISWGTAFLDVDGDGYEDLIVATGSTFEDPADTRRLVPMKMRLYRNIAGTGFVDVAAQSGEVFAVPRVHRGLAIADVDGDLREEVAVVVNGGRLLLLKAEGGPPSHRIAFRCEGRTSNRMGLGTKLVVEAGGRRHVHEIGAGSSYLSQNAPEAIFGLGTSARADSVTVRWPSGKTATFRDLPADRAYLLVEDEGSPRALPDKRGRTLAFWAAYDEARAALAAGRTGESIAAWRKAIEIDPNHEDCRYTLGNLLAETGDRAAARAEFETLLKLQPHSQRGHGALGDLLADPASGAMRDLPAARRHYEAAGGIYHEETGWLVRVGEVELAEGRRAEAARLFRKILLTNPRSFEGLYLLGFLAFEDGNAGEARRLFDGAFAALGPQAQPAPGEGDVKTAGRLLPARGALAPHWSYLASSGRVRMEEAYRDLARELKREDRTRSTGS